MIGIFIGSFNPPTLAHLEICLLLQKKFSKIVFIPVSSRDKNLIDIRERINMLSFYTRKYHFLEIDDIMKNYSYLNYRIIAILKKKYGNISLIMGSDLLKKLDGFDNYQDLLQNYNFIIISRNDDVKEIIHEKYLTYQKKIETIKYDKDISSTIARNLIKSNLSVENILDKDVFNYIKEHDLY